VLQPFAVFAVEARHVVLQPFVAFVAQAMQVVLQRFVASAVLSASRKRKKKRKNSVVSRVSVKHAVVSFAVEAPC